VERYQLQPLSYDLYSGGGGVALFLAGLARVTGKKGYHQAALSAVHPLRQVLYDLASPERIAYPEQVIKSLGLGGASGLGSLLYVLTQVGQLLAEPALLAEARQAALFVNPALITTDDRFDVMLGAAGMTLSLLSLYRASEDETVLAQAAACGRHLLDKQIASPTGPRAWPTLQGKFLTGFAHGAAGIAYALLRLAEEISKTQITQVSETCVVSPAVLRDAAAEAIAYERSVFSAEKGNWPDFRKTGPESAFGLGWCHGAPGIGLARLGGLAGLDTPEIRQDIAIALQTTQQAGLAGVDHVCCGNFGRLELLLVAACQLSYPELHQTAQQQAAQIVARAGQKGVFSLSNSRAYQPGFFQGVAGIGYGLLRLAAPELLPSVLLWT
jgi:type 2 lantibiotic biosynthesis protein LanM